MVELGVVIGIHYSFSRGNGSLSRGGGENAPAFPQKQPCFFIATNLSTSPIPYMYMYITSIQQQQQKS